MRALFSLWRVHRVCTVCALCVLQVDAAREAGVDGAKLEQARNGYGAPPMEPPSLTVT